MKLISRSTMKTAMTLNHPADDYANYLVWSKTSRLFETGSTVRRSFPRR